MWYVIKMMSLVLLLVSICAIPAFAAEETTQDQLLRISHQALSVPYYLSAEAFHKALSADDASFYIVSLQNAEDYAKGHVPGAVRFELDYAKPETALSTLPQNKTIIVTGPNGQRSCQMTIFLRQLGYDAKILLLGMISWNPEYAGSGAYLGGENLSIESTPTPLPLVGTPASQPSRLDDKAIILERTREYALQGRPTIISNQEVAAMKNDALIISMQSPEDYIYSHIAGAANLPAKAFIDGSPELLRLPRDKKIIVACYMGHFSNIGAMILNQLGYEAYSLDWGLAGWNPSGFEKPLPLLQVKNTFPVEQ